MAKTKHPKSAQTYVRRLLEDDFIQEQIRNAASGMRGAYLRARKERGEAVQDKRLYGNLRQAATSIRNAASALQRPEPQPRRGALRKVVTVTLVLSGCVWLAMKLQKPQSQTEGGNPSS